MYSTGDKQSSSSLPHLLLQQLIQMQGVSGSSREIE